MVYSGTYYTVIPVSTWPLALSPLVVNAQVVQTMAPQDPLTIQLNFEGDDLWTQFNFILNNNGSYLNYPAATGPNQLGFGISQNTVLPLYNPIGNIILTQYQPQGYTEFGDTPVNDYSGNPILVSDMMGGRYQISFFLNPTNATASVRLLDLQNNGAQVWSSGTPFNVGGLPKGIQVQLLGIYNQPAAFTQGTFQVEYFSTQSTVQSGPNKGYVIPPSKIQAVQGPPSFTDPLSGNIYQYNLNSGEQANLTSTFTDISYLSAPQTALRQTDTVIASS